jgi:hypothetical protein
MFFREEARRADDEGATPRSLNRHDADLRRGRVPSPANESFQFSYHQPQSNKKSAKDSNSFASEIIATHREQLFGKPTRMGGVEQNRASERRLDRTSKQRRGRVPSPANQSFIVFTHQLQTNKKIAKDSNGRPREKTSDPRERCFFARRPRRADDEGATPRSLNRHDADLRRGRVPSPANESFPHSHY